MSHKTAIEICDAAAEETKHITRVPEGSFGPCESFEALDRFESTFTPEVVREMLELLGTYKIVFVHKCGVTALARRYDALLAKIGGE